MAGRVIIIGGGLAGLSAGCYAQMGTFDARALEHAPRPGRVHELVARAV